MELLGAGGSHSFLEALCRPLPKVKFHLPMGKLELVDGGLGFGFTDAEIDRGRGLEIYVGSEISFGLAVD